MPSTQTTPSDGVSTIAAAQLLKRKNLIVKTATFAPSDAVASNGLSLRTNTVTQVLNLPEAQVTLFLFPTYDRGDFVFVARNFIEWRVVGQMPPDIIPDTPGVSSGQWLPITVPQALPIGAPVRVTLPRGGWQALAIEFDTSNGVPDPNQGEDRVIIDISASE